MRSGKSKPLTTEDRILWSRVARTVTPLEGKALPDTYGLGDEEQRGAHKQPSARAGTRDNKPVKTGTQIHDHGPRPIDKPVHNKIASGRITFDARIDLHGMTQHRAHAVLLDFLHRAYSRRLRHVLVITGKGSSHGSEGILRKIVPEWFATPQFRPYVGGFSDAARHHGGAGALYVRLRRQSGGRKP